MAGLLEKSVHEGLTRNLMMLVDIADRPRHLEKLPHRELSQLGSRPRPSARRHLGEVRTEARGVASGAMAGPAGQEQRGLATWSGQGRGQGGTTTFEVGDSYFVQLQTPGTPERAA
eukprot:CAMPEP_0206428926 /NCGR_PEP_ID=MMETSP0324_2-20121206/5944_1 /ASSEMBLY_ACC=CAM_ASM_000836 /TAXON_ID=2866 /ORGANISM="Crypthecodinium cohnii, Strain Seligo" /LENGTH=115 /DNA_ID=CAMNT_0053894525 /DNA_START=93 /DNA_END=438 /DNA_ORIENTATION=-